MYLDRKESSQRRRAGLTVCAALLLFLVACSQLLLRPWRCLGGAPATPAARAADPAAEAARVLAIARLAALIAASPSRAPPRLAPAAVCAVGAPPWPAGTLPRSILERPLVSIVTTCHDADRALLLETARCVLAQTLPSWEWVVVDDFSASAEAPTALQGLDPRIRLVRSADFAQDSRGNLGRARNIGVRVSRGEYLAFMDADDLFEPTSLEKWLLYLAAHPAAHFVNGFTRGFGAFEYDWMRSVNPSLAFREEDPVAVASLHRRASFDAVGGFPALEGGLEDWGLWYRYAAAGMWGGTVPELLFWYRRRPSHADRWENLGLVGIQRFRARMRELYPALANDDAKWPPPPFVASNPLETAPAFKSSGIPDLGQWPSAGAIRRDGSSVWAAGCLDSASVRGAASGGTAARAADGPRVLLLLGSLGIGAEHRVALVAADALFARGWHVSVFATANYSESDPTVAERRYRSITPDIVILPNLAPPVAFPAVVSAAIFLRRISAVLVDGALGLAMLPLLRQAHGGQVAFLPLNLEPLSASGGDASADLALTPDATYRRALIADSSLVHSHV